MKDDNQAVRIALVQAPSWGVYDPPVALAQLSSYLKQRGFKVKSWDLNIDLYNKRKDEYKTIWANEQTVFWCNKDNVREFLKANQVYIQRYIKEILEFNPLVVAFSVNVASLHATSQLARMIKDKRPDIDIVIGGPSFCVPADLDSILNNEPIDIIVMGEGEETLAELSEMLAASRDLSQCQGICFKQEGKIFKTRPRPVIKNLDELPFLDFSDMPLDIYDPPGHLGKHVSLMASRGCILKCVFCAPREYWLGFRMMGARRIYDEIKFHVKNYPQIEHVEFLDLLINGNMKVVTEFCDLVIAEPLKGDLRWHANAIIRPQMTPGVCKKMRQAGCHHLTFGIESGSQRVLDLMQKHYRIEDADRVLKNVHDAGITVTCNFMFGFPGEREEDFQQTLDFVRRNAKSIDTAYPSRSFCTIEPHSYMERHMDELGIAPNPVNNTYWESLDGKNNYPERVRRCEEFSLLVDSLGVVVGSGLNTSIELDRYWNLGHYYESKKDCRQSLDYFLKYLELDPRNKVINEKVKVLKADCLNDEYGK